MLKLVFRMILLSLGAISSLVSAWYWFVSARTNQLQLDAISINQTAEVISHLAALSAQSNVCAAFAASSAAVLMFLAVFTE